MTVEQIEAKLILMVIIGLSMYIYSLITGRPISMEDILMVVLNPKLIMF
jgi:hypothetical protein